MWRELVVEIISMAIYLMFAAGIYFMSANTLRSIFEKIRMRNRLKARLRKTREEGKTLRGFRQFLSTGMGYDVSPIIFLCILLMFFVAMLVLGIRFLGVISSLTISLSTIVSIFIFLQIRIERVRRKGSHEGEKLVSLILREYRINNLNIYEALEKTIGYSDLKTTNKLLSKLLYDLRNTGDPKKIKSATDDFSYSINTNWSRMLAHNIYVAATKGSDISIAIEDMLIQLREVKTIVEERKRLNSEAGRMTYFMAPSIYFITVALAIKCLDMPIMKLMKNQFATREGLIFFYFILFLFVLNIALLQLVTNQRFDY